MSARNKEIVEKVNAAFAENDVEGFLSFCADDFEFTMVGEKPRRGKEAVRQWMKSMGDMEPPRISNVKTIAEGDAVASQGTMTMKDKGGKTVLYTYCDVYQFQDGKIVKLTAFVMKTETQQDKADVASAMA
jgi:uncharacterized protein (TIGR02246 family)